MKTVIKNKIKTILVLMLLITQSSQAQQIVNIKAGIKENGKYYKDLFGMLDNYVGTWVYTNGTTSLTVKLRKESKIVIDGVNRNYFIDGLAGEYQYSENGVVLINTLPNLNSNAISYMNHAIYGDYYISHNQRPSCPACEPSIYRAKIYFTDPLRPYLDLNTNNSIIAIKNGDFNKLLLKVSVGGLIIAPTPTSPDTIHVPEGNYELTKQ